MPAQGSKAKEEKTSGSRKIEPEKVLFSWKQASRPFERKSRDYWIKLAAIVGMGSMITFIIEGIVPVLLLISIVFLFYVLSTVEPDTIEYSITNKGIKIEDKRTDWDSLTRYWFSERSGSDLVVFETISLPGRLELVVDKKEKEKIRKVLTDYLLEEKAPPSSYDKAAGWFAQKLPKT